MSRYLILSQSDVTARALKVWRELLGGSKAHGPEQMPAPIIFDPTSSPQEGGAGAYRTLVQRVEHAAGCSRGYSVLADTVVLVDIVHPGRLSAISDRSDWDHLIAMLVLTFPEFRWVFGVIQEAGDFPVADHCLLSLLIKPARPALLDPTGLRQWVRARTNEDLRRTTDQESTQLPCRGMRAASIDEEPEYAFLHAYAAYRYGFLSDVVTSWSLMEHLFADERQKAGVGHGFSLIFEDMRLNFPDKPATVHLSRLGGSAGDTGRDATRADHCPLLDKDHDNSIWRILITTGQMGEDRDLVRDNEDYLLAKLMGRGAVVYKPVGGIVDLWDQAGLAADLFDSVRPGNANGFAWPPEFHGQGRRAGHGSPGKLSLVATTLLQRASELRRTADTVLELVTGAVLAVEGTEMLGGKTPTLTLTGLRLKYEFEVKAECAFIGAGYHLRLKRRLEELDAEVNAVAGWFHRESQKKSAWDAKASILSRLTLIFREAGQQEEEQECLIALRRLNRKMSRPERLDPLAWLAHWILSYGEWLLGSFSRILLFTILWIVALTFAASLLPAIPGELPTSQASAWFFEGTTVKEPGVRLVLSWVGAVAGVFHLGILISYLYSLIARK